MMVIIVGCIVLYPTRKIFVIFVSIAIEVQWIMYKKRTNYLDRVADLSNVHLIEKYQLNEESIHSNRKYSKIFIYIAYIWGMTKSKRGDSRPAIIPC